MAPVARAGRSIPSSGVRLLTSPGGGSAWRSGKKTTGGNSGDGRVGGGLLSCDAPFGNPGSRGSTGGIAKWRDAGNRLQPLLCNAGYRRAIVEGRQGTGHTSPIGSSRGNQSPCPRI